MAYDYREAMKEDIKNYIDDNIDLADFAGDRDGLEAKLNDDLWIADDVTGNASGSYTFNSYQAGEYVKENMDLLHDMIAEFCMDAAEIGDRFMNEDWEYFDVSIRCYLVGEVLADVLDEMELDGAFEVIEEDDEEETDSLTA